MLYGAPPDGVATGETGRWGLVPLAACALALVCARPRAPGPHRDPARPHRGDRRAMRDLDAVARALAGRLEGRLDEPRVVRERELHCRVEPRDARSLAQALRAELRSRAAAHGGRRSPQRRAGASRSTSCSRIAPRTGSCTRSQWLGPEAPALTSLATLHHPASRFEREIFDLFGIEAAGHPDPRPLVRHAFWPADYFPLRKDAVAREFHDDGRAVPVHRGGRRGRLRDPGGAGARRRSSSRGTSASAWWARRSST